MTKSVLESIYSCYKRGISIKDIAFMHATNIVQVRRALKRVDPTIDFRKRSHNYKDETGKRYGRLYVKAFYGLRASKRSRAAYYVCTCDCGNSLLVAGYQLRFGQTKSCGCLRRKIAITPKE